MVLQNDISKQKWPKCQRDAEKQRRTAGYEHAPPRHDQLADDREEGRHDQRRDQQRRRIPHMRYPTPGGDKCVSRRVVEQRRNLKIKLRIEAKDDADNNGDGKHDGERDPVHPDSLRRVQSVIAMARSANRSRAESFSVALLSWPQAARMSRPRGVRTGEA